MGWRRYGGKYHLWLTDLDELVLYFQLRLRASKQAAWELDCRIGEPLRVVYPYPLGSATYPTICLACSKLHSVDGSKLLWGCSTCGKHISRRTYHSYRLDRDVHPEILDHALALALYYLLPEASRHERDHSR